MEIADLGGGTAIRIFMGALDKAGQSAPVARPVRK